jgi:hypothetical protein
VLVAGLLGALVFGTAAIVLGFASSFAGDWGNLALVALLQWLVLAAPLMLGFLISWAFASPAIAVIGVVVLPALIEGIISASVLFQLNRVSALNAALQADRIRETLAVWQQYYFTPNLSPGQRLLGEALQNSGLGEMIPNNVIPTLQWDKIMTSVGVAGVYFAIFAALMIWSFRTRDVHE